MPSRPSLQVVPRHLRRPLRRRSLGKLRLGRQIGRTAVPGENAADEENIGTEDLVRIDAAAQRQGVRWGRSRDLHTVVKPHRVSISCICAVSGAAGALPAFLHTASVKWTWLFQKPATMVLPVQSMTRASGGICTSLRPPIGGDDAVDVTMTASASGVASGDA